MLPQRLLELGAGGGGAGAAGGSVNLSGGEVGSDEALLELVVPCMENAAWQRVWLAHNQLGDVSLAGLAQARAFANLRELFLSDNRIGDSGVKSLCKVLLAGQCQLEWLNLSRNQITDQGVCTLCQALPFCSIKVLWLEQNAHITDVGALALAQASQDHLDGLWVASNQIGDAGMLALARAWIFSGRDMHLDYRGNPLSPSMVDEMHRLFQVKSSLKCRLVLAASAARVVPRVAARSRARAVPNELLRLVANCLT